MTQPEWRGPPETHPLDTARGKLARGAQHGRHLVQHCEAYRRANPFRFRVEWDAASNRHLVFLEGRKPPLYLGLILGEVVHDLRSALDHMAWQLAIQHSGRETITQPSVASRIQFPISRTEDAFKGHAALHHFSNEAITAIDPFQPYHNRPADPVNPLLVIQRLSNTDKHQVLTPSMGQLPLGDIRVHSSEPQADIETVAALDTIIDMSAPVMRILASPDARIEIEPLRARVCFGTDVTGTPDFIFAEKIAELPLVITDILTAVEPLFPAVNWRPRAESWVTPDVF